MQVFCFFFFYIAKINKCIWSVLSCCWRVDFTENFIADKTPWYVGPLRFIKQNENSLFLRSMTGIFYFSVYECVKYIIKYI